MKLLVTSRERLNLRWEWRFEIEGLEHPGAETPADKELGDYSAVQLFQHVARRAQRRFSLSGQDKPALTRICQLVEGMPLGIELAAAWVGVHTCAEIVREIEHSLDILATSMQDTPPRHRSMRATFEYSWQLLTPAEQDIFMKLSVFRQGFSPQAAGEVADAARIVLESLVHKSLLRSLPSGRYEMHELLRQYTTEKLAALPETQTKAHDQHCAHYVTFLRQEEANLVGARVAESLAAIKVDIDNVRAAWSWAATRARVTELGRGLNGLSRFYALAGPYQQGETLLRLAADHLRARIERADQAKQNERALLSKLLTQQACFLNEQGSYDQAVATAQEAIEQASLANGPHAASLLQWGRGLWSQGNHQAAQSQFESALELTQDTPLSLVRVDILRGLGNIALTQDDYARARTCYEQSLRISREVGNLHGELGVLGNLAIVSERQGDYAGARDCFKQVLHISREIGDRPHECAALNNLGLISYNLGELAQSRTYHEQSLQIYRELGNRRGEGVVLDNLGSTFYAQGDLAGSRTYREQALHIHRELGNRRGEAQVLGNLGYLFSGLGDYAQARVYCEQSLQVHREIGERQGECYTLNSLGLACACQGDYAQARTYLEQSLRIGREIGEPRIVGYILSNLGHALAGLGRLADAAEACQQALALWQELNHPNLATEPLAGLARIALAQDDLPQAQAHVQEILDHLASGTLDGTEEPARIYLTCYRVLRANRDPRAQEILNTVHGLLQEQAATIGDEELRRSFLENVAVHREIVDAMQTGD